MKETAFLPAPRSRGFIARALAVWPGVAVVVAVVAIGLAMRSPAPNTELAPAPSGWTRFTETGANICLAVHGDDVLVGGKTGLWKIDRKSNDPAQKVKLPVDPIHIRSLECASDGSLWIGHLDGLIEMKDGQFRQWSKSDGLPGSRVNCIREIRGRMIAGTSGGLVELVDGKWMKPAYADKLASKVVNVICPGDDDDIWIGSSSDPKGGLSRVRGNDVQVWRAKDGLPHPYVQDMLAVPGHSVWVATGQFEVGGVAIFENQGKKAGLVKTISKRDGLAGQKARSLSIDSSGAFWIGSESNGLAIDDKGRFGLWTVKGGLPHNEITAIRSDQDGNMWLATLNGAVRIDKEAANRMKEGEKAE